MKPDWKDAPEWARWLAMDDDGEWFWFESEPTFHRGQGVWREMTGRNKRVFDQIFSKFSLEQRPNE